MSTLNDYLDAETLEQLQESLSLVTGFSVQVYASGDEADLLEADPARRPASPIVCQGEYLGRLVMDLPAEIDPADAEKARTILHFGGATLHRLCLSERKLQARVEELATLYRLTALFTEHRDLRHILDTVVATVVEIMAVKACGLRLLNRETGELTIEAVVNLSEDYLDKGKILLADSDLDTEALETEDVVYIADERTDPRVMFPAEARREGIVSALIVPLTYKGGPVGALRLYTDREHRFSAYEVSLVKAIAAQAAAAIVNAQLYQETVQAEAMRRQVELAAAVQRRMIPAAPPSAPRLDLAAVYVPSLELSGDFYDFIELPEGNLALAICDVMGKGVPAGLLTSSIRASLRAHADSVYDLSEILTRVNRSLCDDTQTSSFATLFYGVINTSTLELTYANAGHEPPLLIRGGRAESLTCGGTVLGVYPDLVYERAAVGLQRDDVLLFATDGLIEAMNFKEEQFGRRRVRDAAVAAIERGEDANGVAQHVLWEMRRFAGLRDRGDDVTLVVVRVTG